MAIAQSFVPPSAGAWELEQTHFTKPPSVFIAAVDPEPMMRGFRAGTRHYGVLLDHLEVAVINRFVYTAPRPVGAPKNAKGAPPKLIFKLLTKLHPEIRRRIARAAEVFETKAWRDDIRLWDTDVKPAQVAAARALQAEDLASLSDAQLADHVRRASQFLDQAIFWHHRFNFCAMLPVGDFLVQTMAWTGLSPSDLLQTMRGLSPVSAGATAELEELRRAILTDPEALTLLLSDRAPADVIAALEQRSTPVGAAARAYLAVVGLRVLGGYDVADRHAREHPELLVKIIRAAVTTDQVSRQAAGEEAVARLRERVPAGHRAEFDALLSEAQQTYRIRDERVFHGDAMAIGLARRAILAAGERLQARGRVHDPVHLIDATPGEIEALLDGRQGPSAEELAARSTWRLETPLSAAPEALGLPPSAPPPADWLPPAAARLQRIIDLVLRLLFDVKKDAPRESAETSGPTSSWRALKGFPVSPGVYEGSARVIADVEQLPLVQQGEVLIASSTGPTFNVVLPLIGALVTERGGVLSHAAIVSREYGLPGVVGCVGATKTFKTGDRVRVDGGTGEVSGAA